MKPVNIYREVQIGSEKVQTTFARIEHFPSSGYHIRIRGFVLGRWAGIAWDDKHYLHGPIFYDGNVGANGERISQEVGYVITETNQEGVIYLGTFHICPFPVCLMHKRSEESISTYGITLRIENH